MATEQILLRVPPELKSTMLAHIAAYNKQRTPGAPEMTQNGFIITILHMSLQGMLDPKRKPRAPKGKKATNGK